MDHDTPSQVNNVIVSNLMFYHSVRAKVENPSYTVIATLNDVHTTQLVALATGTQAGLKQYDNDIEDCHAESLLKRAYKRYQIDMILKALSRQNDDQSTDKDRLTSVCNTLNRQRLLLFISQFPCGLIKRFEGQEPVDGTTGLSGPRKPGRGQLKDGKVYYVHRQHCMMKLTRWLSESTLQGKTLKDLLGIKSRLDKVVIGDCEPDPMTDYSSYLGHLRQTLSAAAGRSIECELVHMRHDDFVFDTSYKQPLPVATVCWAVANSREHESPQHHVEYVVDGRKLGITKRQCLDESHKFKLQTSNSRLRSDLDRIREATLDDR